MSTSEIKKPTAKLQSLSSRRGVLHALVDTSLRGRRAATNTNNQPETRDSKFPTHEERLFRRLLAHRSVEDKDEYLVQWTATWEKASSISNLRDALRTLEETKAKARAESVSVASFEEGRRVESNPVASCEGIHKAEKTMIIKTQRSEKA